MAKFFGAFVLATLLAGAIVAGASGPGGASAQPVPSATPSVSPNPSATPTGM